jgi:hypothetical protein
MMTAQREWILVMKWASTGAGIFAIIRVGGPFDPGWRAMTIPSHEIGSQISGRGQPVVRGSRKGLQWSPVVLGIMEETQWWGRYGEVRAPKPRGVSISFSSSSPCPRPQPRSNTSGWPLCFCGSGGGQHREGRAGGGGVVDVFP